MTLQVAVMETMTALATRLIELRTLLGLQTINFEWILRGQKIA
jgi:hypothetical protein